MFVEDLDELGEVGKRARQAIDLVDDDHIHPALPDLGEQKLQGWTCEGGTGPPTIVIVFRRKPPALVGLALDVSRASARQQMRRSSAARSICVRRVHCDRAAAP